MATYVLGGSPLGLINLKSRPNASDGSSTFNAGDSRNIDVNSYNNGREQDTVVRTASGNNIKSQISLFTGNNLPRFWPNISTNSDYTGLDGNYNGIVRDDLHNNEVYDTSILNIIEKLSFSPKASLKPQDFAYLKDVGVYPNNRLMVARRFTGPIKDNIMDRGGYPPKSVLISWKPQDEDFLDFSFGEEWEDAQADFTGIFDSLGKEFRIDNMGGALGAGLGAVPSPGISEQLVRTLYAKLDIFEDNAGESPLPSGNPNIIKKAKQRKLVGYSNEGSGLKFTVKIKMKVVYEQKFISGIDPTIAWMDILANSLAFGTSNSANYGLSSNFRDKIDQWTNNPSDFLVDIIDGLSDTIRSFTNNIKNAIESLKSQSTSDNTGGTNDPNSINEQSISETFSELEGGVTQFFDTLIGGIGDTISASIKKYRVPIMGVANALSGAPSTPWHITLGNPLRPIFCSGDMLTQDVNVKLGPTLAFNDLPSNITIEFTLENARPWGLQEILSKFNTGHLRVVNMRKDYLETVGDNPAPYSYFDSLGDSTTENTPSENNTSSLNNVIANTITTTKENDTQNTL